MDRNGKSLTDFFQGLITTNILSSALRRPSCWSPHSRLTNDQLKMSDVRAEKYYEDALLACKSGVEPKICTEVKKLRVWIQKHQSDLLTDGAKMKLFSAVESYYLYCMKRAGRFEDEVGGLVTDLVEDLLKLPEGKLISGKSKSKALKWLENTTLPKEAAVETETSATHTRWVVGDIDESGRLMLMSERPGSDELIEDFVVHDLEKLTKIQEYFQKEAPILVDLDVNRVLVSVMVTEEDGENVVS